MRHNDFRFHFDIRVRWAEVDAQGIVFNPHYLMYADLGVTEYYRAIGMPYPEAFDVSDSDLYTKKSTIEYHAPAHYDDSLKLLVRVSRLGRSSFDFAIEILRGKDAIASVQIVYVNANIEKKQSVPLSEKFRSACKDYEIVAPMQ